MDVCNERTKLVSDSPPQESRSSPKPNSDRLASSKVHRYNPAPSSSPVPTNDYESVMSYPAGGIPDNDSFDRCSINVSVEDYDYNHKHDGQDENDNRTSNMGTLMHLIKGNLGTGILALPLAFKHAGLWTGLGGVFLVSIIAIHAMHVLVNCSRILRIRCSQTSMDYADVAEYCIKTGPNRFTRLAVPARKLVNGFLLFTQLGFCCVYIVFIATSVYQVVSYYTPGGPSIRIYEMIVTVLLIPYVFVRKLDSLAPFSAFANILTIAGLVITLQYIVQDFPDPSSRPAFNGFGTLPLFIGTAFFTLEGISLVLPLEDGMKRPQEFGGWSGVLNLGMVTVVCLYVAIGFYGFLRFGDDVKSSITLNLPGDEWLYLSVKLMFAVSIFISYGIQFYVPMKIMWTPLKQKLSGPNKQYIGEIVFRILFVLLTFAFAVVVPHLDLLISLIGAFASSSLALILPALIEIFTLSGHECRLPWWVLAKDIVIILFGLIGLVTGTYSTLVAIAEKF